jgi:hypothetical protein
VVRPIKFVGGADEKVATDSLHVDNAMRCELHGVHIRERADFPSASRNRADVVDGSGDVTCVAYRDELNLCVD